MKSSILLRIDDLREYHRILIFITCKTFIFNCISSCINLFELEKLYHCKKILWREHTCNPTSVQYLHQYYFLLYIILIIQWSNHGFSRVNRKIVRVHNIFISPYTWINPTGDRTTLMDFHDMWYELKNLWYFHLYFNCNTTN